MGWGLRSKPIRFHQKKYGGGGVGGFAAQKTGIPKWVATWTKTCGSPLLLNFEPHPNIRSWGVGGLRSKTVMFC